jgi:hypothetical protein
VASSIQSVIGLAVILVYAVMGLDPLVKLFFWLGTSGGFGILLLIAATSVAIVAYFATHWSEETVWHRLIAPGVASALLVVMVYLAVTNYATLLGVPTGHPAARWLPPLFLVAALVGMLWAVMLKGLKPEVYAGIGLGADAVTGRDKPLASPAWEGARP